MTVAVFREASQLRLDVVTLPALPLHSGVDSTADIRLSSSRM
ncbi:hypothetical protein [Bosea sp. Root670]|jgi:hypothetical protein|nr:hypothetical protein [Bosea sp. Root670]